MKADETMLLPTLHKELVNEAFANAFMFPQLGDLLTKTYLLINGCFHDFTGTLTTNSRFSESVQAQTVLYSRVP